MPVSAKSDRIGPIVVARAPISVSQQNAALAAVIALSIGAVAVAPFANVQIARVDVFVPVVQTLLAAAELTTAVLLFAQYSVWRERAFSMLAAGYICSGAFAFLQTLAFPGAYAPAGLIGDGLNSAAWFFVLWHITFPLAVLAYAYSKGAEEALSQPESASRAIILTIALVVGIVAAGAWLVTTGSSFLPGLFKDTTEMEPFTNYLVGVIWLLTVWAAGSLFLRRYSILDLWLIVALIATIPDLMLSTVFSSVRFTAGWYVARTYSLIASGTVLSILLVETTVLYAHLATALSLLRRERAERLMSLDAATAAMAHELRQPLAAIESNAAAALNWLKRSPPEMEEATTALQGIADAVRRAANAISSVRELFRRRADHRSLIHLDELVRQVLAMMQMELREYRIEVQTELADGIRPVQADRMQLQQVVLNLVRNAIDAMAAVSSEVRSLRILTATGPGDTVLLMIEDSGGGIDPDLKEQIFEPFFSTKVAGMGLGLSISRSIVEDHGGTLRVLKTDQRGSGFEMRLPAASGGQASTGAGD